MKHYAGKQLLSPKLVALMLAIVVTLWSMNVMIIKYLTAYFPPIALAGIRLTIASALLLPLAVRRHGLVKLPASAWLQIAAVAFFSIFLHQITLTLGLSMTSATHTIIILSLIPPFTTIAASRFVNEPLSRNKIASLVLGISGVLLIVNPAGNAKASTFMGDGVILLSAIAYVIGSLYVKKSTASTPLLVLTTYSHLFASLTLLIIGCAVNDTWFYPEAFSFWPLFLLFFSALVCTALGALCWNTGTKIIGASQTSLFLNIHPIVGLFASALLLGEKLTWQHYVSLTLVVIGISLGTGIYTLLIKPQPGK